MWVIVYWDLFTIIWNHFRDFSLHWQPKHFFWLVLHVFIAFFLIFYFWWYKYNLWMNHYVCRFYRVKFYFLFVLWTVITTFDMSFETTLRCAPNMHRKCLVHSEGRLLGWWKKIEKRQDSHRIDILQFLRNCIHIPCKLSIVIEIE